MSIRIPAAAASSQPAASGSVCQTPVRVDRLAEQQLGGEDPRVESLGGAQMLGVEGDVAYAHRYASLEPLRSMWPLSYAGMHRADEPRGRVRSGRVAMLGELALRVNDVAAM